MISVDRIRSLAMALPDVEERASYGGRPSWRAGPRMFAWVRDDPAALVVWVGSIEDKEELIASAPDRFFTTSHYDGEPVVLVSLDLVEGEGVGELLADSFRVRAPKQLVERLELQEREGNNR